MAIYKDNRLGHGVRFVSYFMNNKINKTLPGDITFKDGLREGVTLGQLIERLNEDAELSQELEGN